MSRALRLSLFPVALALGLFAEWAALRRGPFEEAASSSEIRLAAADLVVGLVLVGCGVVLSDRKPENWTGILLVAAGLSWFLGTFAGSSESGYTDFGSVFLTLHRGPLVHALLAYPTGRVADRPTQAAIAVSYVLAAVADAGKTPEATLFVACLALAVAGYRYAASAGPERRARLTAAAATTAFSSVLLVSAVTRLAGAGGSVDRGVLWAYQVVLVLIALGVTLDLLLGRWTLATVTGLVVDLGQLGEAGPLQDRLAAALGDPSLVVGYRLPERDAYVDDRGREVELPGPGSDRTVTIVRDQGEPVAALVHDAGALADQDLVDSVAAAARIAVVNARLQAEIRRQVDEIEASRRRIVEAADMERRRLERDLREGAERRLAEVHALLDEAGRTAGDGSSFATMLAETRAELERAQAELGEFARGIHPRVLTDGGLAPALGELAGRAAVPVELSVGGGRFPAPIEAAAYFVCSEALANVGKYAEASRAEIDVEPRNGTLVVSVRDDGRGGASLGGGSGLRGLADRVEALGGRLHVESPPGEGTMLTAELPLTSPSARA
jgi:signal transduction histidine kinase